MWIDANENGIGVTMLGPELFQDGDIVDIDMDTQGHGRFDLSQVHAVGREQDLLRGEARFDTQLHLVDAHTVQSGAKAIDIFQDVDIG